MSTGINMTQVKRRNRSLVLKYLNRVGPVSRKDMADAVGLTSASVTNICNELISEGLIQEVGVDDETKGVGRRKVFIDIDYDSRYVIAFNIEADLSTVALCNLAGDVVQKKTVETDKSLSPEDFLKKLSSIAKKIVSGQSDYLKSKISAVSVGIVGPIDKATGVSWHAYGIWENAVEVKDILEKALKLPCYVENNVNAITKATMLLGIGRKYDNLHIIKWGPGVGSTIVINGEIYEGINGRAAELGHVIIEKDGLRCSCGKRGCLETRVSINALNKIAPFEKQDFYKAYINSKAEKRKAFDDAIDIFARSIVNTITLFAPEHVILSGYLFMEDGIRKRVIETCEKYAKTLEKSTIIPNNIMSCEDYIGPVGAYLYEIIK
ncbi:MAG: ROK family transcriptional regulator [Pseudobutyrivibrio sp.]|nr:ROK family transcriptional regulator [Pseudobutyrivibrio sp.]